MNYIFLLYMFFIVLLLVNSYFKYFKNIEQKNIFEIKNIRSQLIIIVVFSIITIFMQGSYFFDEKMMKYTQELNFKILIITNLFILFIFSFGLIKVNKQYNILNKKRA